MEAVDLMLTEARLWMSTAGHDPADRSRIVYSDSVLRPPPLSCKAVAAIMSSNKKPEEDDEGGGSSSGGARASPPPRAPVRQSHPTTPSSRPQTAPNQGSSKGTGRGSGSFSQTSLTMLLLLALRMPQIATTGTGSNPFESKMLKLRPLTDPESDEAGPTMMSTNPLNLTFTRLSPDHPL